VTHPDTEALVVERLSMSFAGRTVLQSVSFALHAGEFCGLIGANGSGKTTLLRTLLGFHRADAGVVRIAAPRRAAIGYVPQKITFDPTLPLRARDVVALGLDGGRLGLPLPSARRRALVDEMLAAVDARDFAEQRIGNLSGGQQQRVLIAHALIRRPLLLLLDEPLANLDLRSTAEIVGLLRRISAEHRIAVLISAHDMNPLLPAIDRIVYLANGRAASGRTDEVIRSEILSELYGCPIGVVRVHGQVLVVSGTAASGNGDAIAAPPVRVAAVS
jgi:zinc/manganese transport system ATP-binding protein